MAENQSGKRSREAKGNAAGSPEATVRRKDEAGKGRNRDRVARILNGRGSAEGQSLKGSWVEAAEADARTKPGEEAVKRGGHRKHLWNGCGSEAGRSEREQTGKLNKRNRMNRMGNQAVRKGKIRGSRKASLGRWESHWEAEPAEG